MGLQVRRASSVKFQVLTTLIAVFALVAQPLYGLVSSGVANAVGPSDVWITAAMPNPSPSGAEYVTLKNVSSSALSLNGWHINTTSDYAITTTQTLASGNSVTICDNAAKDAACNPDYSAKLVLPNSDSTITLTDASNQQIDQVNYTSSQIATKGQEVTFSHSVTPVSTSVPSTRIHQGASWMTGTSYLGATGEATVTENFTLDANGKITGAANTQLNNENTSHPGFGYSGVFIDKPSSDINRYGISDGTSSYNYPDNALDQPGDTQSGVELWAKVATGDVNNWTPQASYDKTYTITWKTNSAVVSSETVTLHIVNNSVTPAPAIPTGVHFVHGTTPIDAGSTIDYTDNSLAFIWNTASGIDKYDVVVTQPDGTTEDFEPAPWSPLPATMSYQLDRGDANRGYFGVAGQGDYTYKVRARSASTGLWSDFSAPISLGYDKTAPSAQIVNPPKGVNGNFPVTVNFSDNVGLGNVYVDVRAQDNPDASDSWRANCENGNFTQGALSDRSANASGVNITYSCTVNVTPQGHSPLASGTTYTLRAYAKDAAGNWTTATTRDYEHFTYDTSAPSDLKFVKTGTSTVVSTANPINYHNVTLEWTPINPLGTSHDRYRIESTTPGCMNGTYDTGWDTYTLDDSSRHGLFGSQQGACTYQVEYQNPYTGIWTDWSSPVTLTYDNVRPDVQFTQKPSSIVNSNFQVSATISDANDIDLSSVFLQVEDLGANARAAKCEGGKPTIDSTDPKNVVLSCTIDISQLQDNYSQYVVQAWGKDVAGNSSSNITGKSLIPFTVDRIPPQATSITYSNGGSSPSQLTKDNVTVTIDTSEAVQPVGDGWTQTNPTQLTKTFTDNGLFTVTLVDLAGNSSVVSGQVKRIDRAAPIISGISDGDIVNSTVHLSINDPAFEGYFGFDALHGLTINGNPVATTEIAGHNFATDVTGEGTYTVVATDKAGNSTAPITFTIDTTAPILSNFTVTSNADGSYTLSVQTDDPSAPVEFSQDGAALKGTTSTDGGTTWTNVISELLANKSYTFTASTTDAAGNPASSTQTYTLGPVKTSTLDNNLSNTANFATAVFSQPLTQAPASQSSNTKDDTAVLGAKTKADNSDTAPLAATPQGWKIFGIAWYWILIAIAIVGSGIWWTIVALRRRALEDAI